MLTNTPDSEQANRNEPDDLAESLIFRKVANHLTLTPNELKLWLNYIEHEVGFILPSSQTSWVKSIIERYLQRYQLTTTALLARLSHDKALYHQVFDAILIPRTQFFRELPTFKFIESYARHFHLDNQTTHRNRPLTVWSVGCSSGQETVSLSLSIAKAMGRMANFHIFGSDFHQKSLAIARRGQYELSQMVDIPQPYHIYLEKQPATATPSQLPIDSQVFGLKPELAQHLTYFSHNLMQPLVNLPVALGSCQLIVCKNVLIYFRQFDQRDIINQLVDYLSDDGVLILGAGELPNFSHPRLKKLPYPQINGFCKINSPIWLEQLYLGH